MPPSEVHVTAPASVRRTEASASVPLLAKGFRPFFLLAAAWAVVAAPLWILVLEGRASVSGPLVAVPWHAHAMVFGFTVAVVAGFLLTAVENWTSRVTARGGALAALAGLWLAGRIGLLLGGAMPPSLAAAVDALFLPVLAAVVARPILAAGSRRNLVFPLALLGLAAANAAIHVGALGGWPAAASRAPVVGVDLALLMIVVVTGRIVPMFTRNALGADGVRGRRALDRTAAWGVVALAAVDAAGLEGLALVVVAGATAVVAAVRMVGWRSLRTLHDPLLAVLHLGAACVPAGLALRAAAAWSPSVPGAAGMHLLTIGAIGLLTLGMMVRVALGHTGRRLVAGPTMAVAFVLVALAAAVRVVGALAPAVDYRISLHAAAGFWALGFLLYLVVFTPRLLRPRVDGKPG